MSDTPRTDSAIISADGKWTYELRDLCRGLERELANMTEIAAKYEDRYFDVKEQRDRLAEERDELKSKYQIHHDEAERITNEMRRVTSDQKINAERLQRLDRIGMMMPEEFYETKDSTTEDAVGYLLER